MARDRVTGSIQLEELGTERPILHGFDEENTEIIERRSDHRKGVGRYPGVRDQYIGGERERQIGLDPPVPPGTTD